MAKPGNKGKSAEIHALQGTEQPGRGRVAAFNPMNGEPAKPKKMTRMGSKIWDERVAKYKARGMSVVGMEESLEEYCELKAELKDARQKRIPITVAKQNAYRVWANEFFDTPASQQVSLKQGLKDNPFQKNGRKPGA
jgi:hypothetical protein